MLRKYSVLTVKLVTAVVTIRNDRLLGEKVGPARG